MDVYEAMCGALDDVNTIAIRCKTLTIEYIHVRVRVGDENIGFSMVPDRFERLLLDMLTISTQERKVKESCERWFENMAGEKGVVEE